MGRLDLLNSATHQVLLDCNHSKAHNFKWEGGAMVCVCVCACVHVRVPPNDLKQSHSIR